MRTPQLRRRSRSRDEQPRSVPWPTPGGPDTVGVDTTWGELQPLEAAPGVRTVGELEIVDLLSDGAVLVDCRTRGSFGGRTIVHSTNIPHTEIAERRAELPADGVAVLFCNGPQCPQSPQAIRELLDAGVAPASLAYYRGGMHDWITLAMPTEVRVD